MIEFEEHFENILILRGFDPYSPLYSLIRDYNVKLVILEFFFYTSSCVFSDRTDLSRQRDAGQGCGKASQRSLNRLGSRRLVELFLTFVCMRVLLAVART